MAPKRTIANLYSSKYYCEKKKLKTCQERPHLTSGRFIKVFYKKTTCPIKPRVAVLHRFDCSWYTFARLALFTFTKCSGTQNFRLCHRCFPVNFAKFLEHVFYTSRHLFLISEMGLYKIA